jgi:hypothetical protein
MTTFCIAFYESYLSKMSASKSVSWRVHCLPEGSEQGRTQDYQVSTTWLCLCIADGSWRAGGDGFCVKLCTVYIVKTKLVLLCILYTVKVYINIKYHRGYAMSAVVAGRTTGGGTPPATHTAGIPPTRGEAGSPTSHAADTAAVDSADAAAPATSTRASLFDAISVQFFLSSFFLLLLCE